MTFVVRVPLTVVYRPQGRACSSDLAEASLSAAAFLISKFTLHVNDSRFHDNYSLFNRLLRNNHIRNDLTQRLQIRSKSNLAELLLGVHKPRSIASKNRAAISRKAAGFDCSIKPRTASSAI
jgi:hypothetical protein